MLAKMKKKKMKALKKTAKVGVSSAGENGFPPSCIQAMHSVIQTMRSFLQASTHHTFCRLNRQQPVSIWCRCGGK
jgi:hypothetical protein